MKVIGLIFSVMCMLSMSACGYFPKRLTWDNSGKASVVVSESSGTNWMILNNCKISDFGSSGAKSTSSYPAEKYGDIFFVDYSTSEPATFLAKVIAMQMLKNDSGCERYRPSEIGDLDFVKEIYHFSTTEISKQAYDTVKSWNSSRKIEVGMSDVVSAMIVDVADKSQFEKDNKPLSELDMRKKIEETLNAQSRIAPGKTNLRVFNNQIELAAKQLTKYPMPPVFDSSKTNGYVVRKDFSTLTAKTGFVFAPTEDTAAYTAHISVYPAVPFLKREYWSPFADRFSIDLGVAKAVGSSASQGFKEAETIYLMGVGFDITDNFALQAGSLMWFESGKTHQRFYSGVTFNLLGLASSLK